jgi:hypothetical protein
MSGFRKQSGTEMPTLGELIQENILRLNPLATVHVSVFQAGSRAIVAENGALIYVPWGPNGRTILVAETPFTDDELGNRAPAGIRYFVASAAFSDEESTMRYFVYVASRLHSLLQLSANASAFPLQLRLMSVWGTGMLPFRELIYEPEISHPINSRIANVEATNAVCSAGWRTQEDRVARAAVQYEIALRRMHGNETPLAIAHLYMGVEAITKAVIRFECAKRNVTEEDLGLALGLDAASAKSGSAIESAVRKRLIFREDQKTYTAARGVSDGIEHGFASWDEIWALPLDEVLSRTAGHLRAAILRVLDMESSMTEVLLAAPFDTYVEGGPRIAYESRANISNIDLRATDFRIAKVRRVMSDSRFDRVTGEYRYAYTLKPDA